MLHTSIWHGIEHLAARKPKTKARAILRRALKLVQREEMSRDTAVAIIIVALMKEIDGE